MGSPEYSQALSMNKTPEARVNEISNFSYDLSTSIEVVSVSIAAFFGM